MQELAGIGSITCTASESLAQTNRRRPSFEKVSPRGRRPTGKVRVTSQVAESITETVLSRSFET